MFGRNLRHFFFQILYFYDVLFLFLLCIGQMFLGASKSLFGRFDRVG